MTFGTLTRFDTMATAFNTTVAQFGEDNAWNAIADALAAHNQQLADAMGDLATTSTDRQRRYGGPDSMAMEELDEFGTPDAQKISAGVTCGFPLRFYGIALQWTRLYFINVMASELAAQVTATQDADVKAIHRELKKALFLNTNYTFVDRRVDGVSLGVKSLVNADGAAIPLAPDGTSFVGATHTHYVGATVAWSGAPSTQNIADDLNTLAANVLEHFLSGSISLYINRSEETRVRSAVGFTPYVDARILMAPGGTANVARGSLDMSNVNNRAIGIIGPSEVWVKPWIPPGYVLAIHTGGGEPALLRRVRNGGGGNLDLLYEDEKYPLRARALGREFGFGVYNRVAAACLFVNGTTYTNPTIT